MRHAETLSDAFDAAARRAGGRLAVREKNRDWTYAELLVRSQDLSRRLEAMCRAPGQRIALMLPNSGAFVAAFFAVARLSSVVNFSTACST